jgi:hypothetical protein
MTIILDYQNRTTVDRRPVTVTVSGLPSAEVRITTRDTDSGGARVMYPRPAVMVLSQVSRRTVVRVMPGPGRSAFPERSVLTVRLTTEPTGDFAGDDVVVQAVEVSGLAFRDIVAVDVEDERRLSVSAINAVVDVPLDELSAAARSAARARLGVDRTAEAVNVLVAVDMSASMGWAFERGAAAAAVQVVVGVSQVIGWGADLGVVLLVDRPTRLDPVAPRELSAATMATINQTGLGCGFRSTPFDLPVRAPSVTYVLSDAVPPDLAAARRAHRPGDARHLVLVADPDGPAPDRVDGLPITSLPVPRNGADTVEHLLGHHGELSRMVDSLLADVVSAGRAGDRG